MADSPHIAETDKRTRILLVDDHPIVRQGISLLVDQEPDMMVCAEADSAPAALRALEKARPDVAVVDLTLKESLGLELVKDIRARFPEVLVLVYSMRDESFYAERVLRAGARGYVTKEEGGRTVLEGVRRIMQGQVFLSEKMASKMLGRIVGTGRQELGDPIQKLSDRELEVFEMIGQGLPTREIAERLHLSPKTVDSHREHIKEKLQIDSATELLKHAIEWVRHRKGM
ncbi:MAG TPA: response regulator transcription factor [Phycisphaerae bacterium]|nr:response regulator transcription factor [Phycisphaerae bacterium]